MTMTSTGYGSFFIHSTPQMMNAMTTMFFECFLFGYLVGNIQTIIKKNNAENNYYEAIITQIKKYMSTKRIPKSLRSRVIQYIYYLRNISKNRFNEEEILSCLSSQMKDDIYVHTRGRSLESCPAFKVYPNTFIRALGRKLLIEVHAPGDLIFKEGEMSNSIYFIQSGTVEIYHENTKTVFRELRKGKYFGEISFFMGTTRSASARSLMYGEILSLSGNALSRLLISRPKEKEITELLISECLKDLSALGVRCYLCTVLGHVASDCEAYKYKLDKQKIA